MEALARELAERLRIAGAEHEQFLRYGPPAAANAAGSDSAAAARLLHQIADLTALLHEVGFGAWSTLHFGVEQLADVFPGDAAAVESLIAELAALARALKRAGLDDLAMQRLPATIHSAKGKPWLAASGLALARQLADAGADPGDMLRIAFPAIAVVAGHDAAGFTPVGTALLGSFAAMSAHGIVPTWPIAQGVVALAGAYPQEPAALAHAVRELAELAIVVKDAGGSPHPLIEHGITSALQQTGEETWLRDEVFPLAFAMASAERSGNGAHTGEPILALQRIGALRGFEPARGMAIAARLRTLAERGLDPAMLLAVIPALREVAGENLARFDVLFDLAVDLLETIHAGETLRPAHAFEEGIPYSLATPGGAAAAERILMLARAMARKGFEPGPAFQHGLSPALHDLVGAFGPEIAAGLAGDILAAAESVLGVGVNPWRLLTPGVYAAAHVAQRDPLTFVVVLGEIRDLALSLARAGVDPEPILTNGVLGLATSLGENGRREVFSATLNSLRDFAPGLSASGIDPGASASRGLAAVARVAQTSGAAWLVPGAADLGRRLAAAGIDPAGVLETALPAMVKALGAEQTTLAPYLDEIVATASAQRALGRMPESPLEKVVAASVSVDGADPGGALRAAMRLMRETAGATGASAANDASALAEWLLPALAPVDAPVRDAMIGAASRFLVREPFVFGHDAAAAAAACVRVAGSDAAAFERLLAELVSSARLVREASPAHETADALLRHGFPAAAEVAGTRCDPFVAIVRRLATRVATAGREGSDLSRVLGFGAMRIARASAGRPDAFHDGFDALIRVGARSTGTRDESDALGALLLEHAAPMAINAAGGDSGELVRGLEDVARLRASSSLGEEARYVLPWLGRFGGVVRTVPSFFRDVLLPVLRSPAPVASVALRDLERLSRWIVDEEASSVLKHVVTQEGVRGPEILSGLLLPGLEGGAIVSLSDEREILVAFLRDVPIVDPGFYAAYRRIVTDPKTSDAARRDAVRALEEGVAALAAAVVAGEVPADRHDDPMLAHVLFHVFPPAVSVTRDRYLELWRAREDHPAHVVPFAKREGLGEVRLPRGGYRLREGETIDPAPWESLRAAVVAVHASGSHEELLEPLGKDLFDAWIDGEIGTPKARGGFLVRIYRRFRETGKPLPEVPASAEELLRYREFLADTAREIVQEALRAVRAAAPDRYERLTRAKLSPPPHVGPGLVRAVWAAIESARAGTIDPATASERIAKQLRSFDLTGREEELLAALSRDALEAILAALPAKAREVELGAEHVRVLQDLAGADLAAMQRELFGDGRGPGKLEYRRDAAAGGSVLRLEPTKRRAHVPIGFCEGVCTAVDEELWNQPRFVQVVFWGPDARARGGMHLLLVERAGTTPALALPGINPSLDVLGESGAEAVLDALLAWAVALAKANGLGAVWIPDHRGILSNRGPIHGALDEKKLPTKTIPSTTFSYRPYGYTFDRVLVVWES